MARRPLTFKQRDVTRALRGAALAGIEVQKIEIDKDGKISIVIGKKQAQTLDDELDQELAEFRARHGYD